MATRTTAAAAAEQDRRYPWSVLYRAGRFWELGQSASSRSAAEDCVRVYAQAARFAGHSNPTVVNMGPRAAQAEVNRRNSLPFGDRFAASVGRCVNAR